MVGEQSEEAFVSLDACIECIVAIDAAPKPGVGGVKYLLLTASLPSGIISICDRGTSVLGSSSLRVVLVKQQNSICLPVLFPEKASFYVAVGPDILFRQVALFFRKYRRLRLLTAITKRDRNCEVIFILLTTTLVCSKRLVGTMPMRERFSALSNFQSSLVPTKFNVWVSKKNTKMATAEMVDDLGVNMLLTFRGVTRHMHRSMVTRAVSQHVMRMKRVCGIAGMNR